MKKNFQKGTFPTENGLVGAVSQAFADTGYTLTPLETKCLSFVGYLPGRPGRGSCKHSAYALIKEERAYVAIISIDSRNPGQPQKVDTLCLPLDMPSHADIDNHHRHWEHSISNAFHSLGGTSFSHIEVPDMRKITTDGTEEAYGTMITGDIYLVYAGKAYKVVLT